MKDLASIILTILNADRRAFARGFALAVTVLAMGVALLGLSGWFIVASAAAGMAGMGILFNVFAPSAMVRFLALGRTAARYGERVLTHDATLRAVSDLRVSLLRGLLTKPHRALERLRANSELNRITADTEALDGVLLRLVIPAAAGGVTIMAVAVTLWILVHPSVALIIGGGYLVLPTAIFFIGQRIAKSPARLSEAALQAGRSRMIDLVSGRDDLSVFGQLLPVADQTIDAFNRGSMARERLESIERRTGLALDMVTAIVTTGCLVVGVDLVQAGEINPATAAIGVFASLALAEAVAPVRRALSEIGRMTQAARRVRPTLDEAQGNPDLPIVPANGNRLQMEAVTLEIAGRPLFAPVTLDLGPGETVVLEGASGSGKSTVLLLAIGAFSPTKGQVRYAGRDPAKLPVSTVTEEAVLVPQRHALIADTVAANLRLAAPGASDETLWRALDAVCLSETLRDRGGLQLRLGPRGAGLSGGEARRLVLARAILRDPALMLLDEPTEGLDDTAARQVMTGLRKACPQAAFLIAAHRSAEKEHADHIVRISTSRATKR
ncbi:amino acid ABC transporter ATP-binding/permease protein [Actibacterium lipolyticum]|uniref:Putative ABC transporter ATP-binding protein n=1 Tax=Actibacterium lipolyticum TaxID=1524263 RepID=A0A238KL84_9RHOB|nr:ATP-binding cassette domain-containing protein [Actibacterium lipolyticum]SMX43609.1 putative ABC transporter ATP-binding protein [Actibacterium lipolyticum]